MLIGHVTLTFTNARRRPDIEVRNRVDALSAVDLYFTLEASGRSYGICASAFELATEALGLLSAINILKAVNLPLGDGEFSLVGDDNDGSFRLMLSPVSTIPVPLTRDELCLLLSEILTTVRMGLASCGIDLADLLRRFPVLPG